MRDIQPDRSIAKIQGLEAFALKQPQVEIPLVERIVGSMYVREILIPKGTIITSRVYKRAYVDIMISGDIDISDSNGSYRLTGYNMLEGSSGRKRAGHAREDTVWVTIHDLEDIKDDPINDISFETIEEHREYEALSSRESFSQFLTANRLDPETVKAQSVGEPYEPITGEFYLSESIIDGQGVFASRRFLAGEHLGMSVIDDKKTQLGRFVNHSNYPNCVYSGDQLIALRSIDSDQEVTVSYSKSLRLELCPE